MRLNSMDETLRKINELQNIEAIYYTDLSLTSFSDKYIIIPSFLVFYQGLKSLNLCAQDKYFDVFVKKLRKVYLEEKDKVIEIDSFQRKKYIQIDEKSKKLLLEGNLEEVSDLYQFYHQKESYQKSLFFMEDKIKTILPIVKYHIQETLKLFDRNIEFNRLENGSRDNFFFDARLNSIPIIVPVHYHENHINSYTFDMGGLLDRNIPLHMNILFDDQAISITTIIDEYQFYEKSVYEMTEIGMKEKVEVYIDGELKIYQQNDLDKKDIVMNHLVDIGYKEELTWYQLPWNAFYGTLERKKLFNETEGISYQRSVYLDYGDDYFVTKDKIVKKYKRKSTNYMEMKDITLEYVDKTTIGIKDHHNMIMIETSFQDDGMTGYYKDYLSGKIFYHLSEVDDIKKIDQNHLISLGQKDGIYENVDLLKREKLKKILIKKVGK